MGEELKGSGKKVVRERDVHSSAHSKKPHTRWPNSAIHDRTDDQWSWRGRYSLHTSKQTSGANPGFSLNVIECTQDQWMENALVGKEKKPKPLGKLAKLPLDKFGLVFKKPDGHGGTKSFWPQVTATSSGNTIADEFPSITVGSAITKINGNPVPET